MKGTMLHDDTSFGLKFGKARNGPYLNVALMTELEQQLSKCMKEIVEQGKCVKALKPIVKKE